MPLSSMRTPAITAWMNHWWHDTFVATESTRPLAIARIGLVAIVWSFWALRFALFEHLSPMMHIVGAIFLISGIAAFMGLRTRYSMPIFGCTCMFVFYYAGTIDRAAMVDLWAFDAYNVQFLCYSIFLLSLSDCGRSLSVDRYFAVRAAAGAGESIPDEIATKWPRKLLLLHLCMLFFWGAVAKANVEFLSGHRLEQLAMSLYFGSDYPENRLLVSSLAVVSWSVFAGEMAIALCVLIPSFRHAGACLILLFAASIFYLLPQHNFAYTVSVLAVLLIPPSSVDRFLMHMLGAGSADVSPAVPHHG